MKTILSACAIVFLFALPSFAQTDGALLPEVSPVFLNANGSAPAANGFVCTFAAGTTTLLATYADSALMTANQNPIRLNAGGRPNNSGTLISIYMQAASYKINVYAAGTGNTCNGVNVGTLIRSIDNVYDIGQLIKAGVIAITSFKINNIRYCNAFAGATAGAKIAACIADLPSTGGTADSRGLEGAQTISSDPFSGVTKPVMLLVGAATFTVSTTITIPAKSTIRGIGSGSKFIASSSSAPSAEMFTLLGDEAAIENIWAYGSGQVMNTPDTHRCIWIGAANHTTRTNYARVENVICEQFTGNGISGVYSYAKILHNQILSTTDAGIFCPGPTECTNNLFEGNTVRLSRYSGFDFNGSDNRVIGNRSDGNGGGSADQASWSGFLVAYTSSTGGSNNVFEGNSADSNIGCGFRLYGMGSTGGIVNAPRGNIFKGNIATNHTTAYTDTSPTQTEWSGGFCVLGGNSNTVDGNTSVGNVFNYVVTGYANVADSVGTIVKGNQSFNAVTNAALTGAGKPAGVGFFFPGGTRIDGTGAGHANYVTLTENIDRYAASDSYRIDLAGAAAGSGYLGYIIARNQSHNAGGYGYNLVSAAAFVNFDFTRNEAISPTTAKATGFAPVGLTANSTTPSVEFGELFKTQNSSTTAISNFTNPIYNQAIEVEVNDNNTTFDFTSSSLKGNAGVDYIAATGDKLYCKHDGTNWWCDIRTQAVTGGFAQGLGTSVTQLTNKSTSVTANALYAFITLNNESITNGVANAKTFTWTNSYITANSNVICVHHATGTIGGYYLTAIPGSSSAAITLVNNAGGALGEAIVLACRVFPTQ